MRFIFVYLLISFPFFFVHAQNHDFIWLFGSSDEAPPHSDARLDFNIDPPLLTHDPKPMMFYHSCTVTADQEGKLLFYSNGKSISSYNHQTMQNGGGLNPDDQGYDWVNLPQCIVSLPMPGQLDEYYLLHAPWKIYSYPDYAEIRSFAFMYTIINMEENNGLGSVTVKNQAIISDSLWVGKVTAVQHANGRDWWVLTNKWMTNKYYKMLLSPQGIEVVDTQAIGTPVIDGLGQAVFSPDGSKYVIINAYYDEYLQIFDFDRCNGELSNEVFLHYPKYHNTTSPGIAISPNSRFLYFSATDTIYQYDLWADDIPASEIVVGSYDGHIDPFNNTFYLAQLAPDGKIYICVPNGSNYLHTIEKPDKKGLACDFKQHTVNLMNRNGFSIPNNPNYRLGPVDDSICDSLNIDNVPISKFRYVQDSADYLQIVFTNLSYYNPVEWNWDFGDGSISQDTSPIHVFSQDGVYEVCLTVNNVYGSHTSCKTLQIGTVSTAEAINDIRIQVFPNPSYSNLNVLMSECCLKEALLVLFDNFGEKKFSQELNEEWNYLNMPNLSPGMYFYEIFDNNVKLAWGKIMIIK